MATSAPVVPGMQPGGRIENLALIYQEMLTVIARLRSNRQAVADAELFRAKMRGAIKKAEQDAVARGYTAEDVRTATFAIVAFLDESVLNLGNPVFADWHRKHLAVEFFGMGVAGEIFFQTLEGLLRRRDSRELADLLEVYHLCMLLGYRGRYALAGIELFRPKLDEVSERIRRIRGALPPLYVNLAPAGEQVVTRQRDQWFRWLLYGAVGCLVLALLLFVAFKFSLGSGVSDLHTAVTQGTR